MASSLQASTAFLGFFLVTACGGDSTDSPTGGGDGWPETGLWFEHEIVEDDSEESEAMKKLASLPYTGGADVRPKDDKIRFVDAARVQPGLNLFVSGHATEAILMDIKGNTRHRWSCSAKQALGVSSSARSATYFRCARVLSDGSLVVLFDGVGVARIDRTGKPVWRAPGRYHSDVCLDADGTVWTLAINERDGGAVDDLLCRLGPDGKERQPVSLLDAFASSEFASAVGSPIGPGPVLRAASVEVLDGGQASSDPALAAGNVLIACAGIDALAIVDPSAGKVLRVVKGDFQAPHDATALDGGRFLVFDNGGGRVVEVDGEGKGAPLMVGDAALPVVSETMGSCARLPNGNTLVTDPAASRAIEVTADGGVCWDFVNPNLDPDELFIAATLQVERVPMEAFDADFAKIVNPVASGGVDDEEARRLLEKLKGKKR